MAELLLAGLHQSSRRTIAREGRDVAVRGLAELRTQVAIILQDRVRYPMTTFENVAVRRIDAMHNREHVHR